MAKRIVKVVLPRPIILILAGEKQRTGLSESELLRNAYIEHLKRHNLYTELVHSSPGEKEQ